MKRRAVITVVVMVFALVVGGAAVPAVGQEPGAIGPSVESPSAVDRPNSSLLPEDGTSLPTDSRAIRIRIRPDGDAVWHVQYRMRLDGENATASFESIESRVESDPLQFTGPFNRMMQQAADVAANDTGRAMAIRNVSVHARELPNQYGVVTYRFEWAGFATTSGGTVHVGDALGGMFLASDRSSLLVEWPAGFQPSDVSPAPDDEHDRAVVWRGPTEFASDEPRVVLTGGNPLPVDTTGLLAGSALLLVVGAVGWQVWTRRETDTVGTSEPTGTAAETVDHGSEPQQSPTDGAPADANTAEPASTADDAAVSADTGDPATAPHGNDAGTGTTASAHADAADAPATDADGSGEGTDGVVDDAGDDADEAAGPPPELLSDEERVLQLLEANGGRMKQQDVVATMEWSETKTSQVVKEMRENDQIEVFRLGRENVLSLPGEMDV